MVKTILRFVGDTVFAGFYAAFWHIGFGAPRWAAIMYSVYKWLTSMSVEANQQQFNYINAS